MSYELSVFASALPTNLREAWQAALVEVGLNVEVQPDFDDSAHSGALAWKFQVTNAEVFRHASLYPAQPIDAGFELTIRDADIDLADWKRAAPEIVARISKAEVEFAFSNPNSCSPADFRLQWFAAATLAQLTDGVLQDPQEERSFLGKAALAEAAFQADQYEEELESDWPEHAPFQGW